MPHCLSKKISLVHIPKNAGTAVSKHLGLSRIGHYSIENEKALNPDHFFFYIKRNPFSRFISSFQYAKMKNSHWHNESSLHHDFKTLYNCDISKCIDLLLDGKLSHYSWSRQTKWIKQKDENPISIRGLSFENLESDLKNMLSNLNIEAPEYIPKINSSTKILNISLNKEQENTLYEYYKEDFELLDYDKNMLYSSLGQSSLITEKI